MEFCRLDLRTFSANFVKLKSSFRFLDVWVQAYQWSQSEEGMACPLFCIPPDFCPLQAGMGLGQWYLAIDFFARLSPNLARNCTEGRGKKAIIVKFFCLPRGWREAVTPWPCVHRGMAQVIFQGLEGARHKADN